MRRHGPINSHPYVALKLLTSSSDADFLYLQTYSWISPQTPWLPKCGPFRYRYSGAPQYRMSRDQQISSVIGGFSLLPIYEVKRNDSKEPKFSIYYWRISVTLGSGIAGLNCTEINCNLLVDYPPLVALQKGSTGWFANLCSTFRQHQALVGLEFSQFLSICFPQLFQMQLFGCIGFFLLKI